MTQRCVIVGDVHGCFDELMELMDECQVTDEDWVVSLGDVCDRGPKVREAVDFFMSRDKPRQRSQIFANHEERQLKYYAEWQKRGAPTNSDIIRSAMSFKADYHEATFLALEPKHFEWFKTLPKYLKLGHWTPCATCGVLQENHHICSSCVCCTCPPPPECSEYDGRQVTLVHAGCLPQVPIEDNTDLIRLHASDIMPPVQGIDLDKGFQHGYWKAEVSTWWTSKAPPGAKFFATLYDGASGFLVFGHSGFEKPAWFDHALGLDTGCCFGGALSALILPDWRIVSVPSRGVYKSRRTGKVRLYEIAPGVKVFS